MVKKRVVKQNEPSSGTGGVQRTSRTKNKEGAKAPQSQGWLRRGLLALLVIFIGVPVSLKMHELIQHLVYTHRIRVPFFVDLSQPAEFSLNHTINMYLTSEEGISLGVWAAPHRVGVAKILSALGYHVLVPDYRGFGDSTGEPTEAGLTTDALYLYNWVKERSGNSLVVIWGHSLGTGVGTNAAVKLQEQGMVLDGVILEGAFNSARQPIPGHPFVWFYWKFPGVGYLYPAPWANNHCVFPSEENLKKMRNPILFLHSEDDHLVPIEIAHQTYEVAMRAQNAERVKLVTFEGSLGYLHNGLYRDPRLPDIIKRFVQSL